MIFWFYKLWLLLIIMILTEINIENDDFNHLFQFKLFK